MESIGEGVSVRTYTVMVNDVGKVLETRFEWQETENGG